MLNNAVCLHNILLNIKLIFNVLFMFAFNVENNVDFFFLLYSSKITLEPLFLVMKSL